MVRDRDYSPKQHLLDTRMRDLFHRLVTRCGKFPKGETHHSTIGDWDNKVEEVPREGVKYCKKCMWHYKDHG